MTNTLSHYLNEGLPQPVATELDEPYWSGLANNQLLIQRCNDCGKFQWGPEWLCHRCHSFSLQFDTVAPEGIIYSYERVWHPVHPALKDQGAYLIVLVELPHADNVRLVGNLLGDPQQSVTPGEAVTAVFEHHAGDTGQRGFTLLQWQTQQK